jgi:hypothetical protein
MRLRAPVELLNLSLRRLQHREYMKGLRMSVSAVGAANATPVTPQQSANVDPPHDGDSDDAAAAAPVQAAPAPGTGVVVDKKA